MRTSKAAAAQADGMTAPASPPRSWIPPGREAEYWAEIRAGAAAAPPPPAEALETARRILGPLLREIAAERQQPAKARGSAS